MSIFVVKKSKQSLSWSKMVKNSSVTHVSEHLLPMSPVYTNLGEGRQFVTHVLFPTRVRVEMKQNGEVQGKKY